MGGQPQRCSGVDEFDVDINVVARPAVPGKSYLVAVWRKSRAAFMTRKTGEGHDFHWWQRGFGSGASQAFGGRVRRVKHNRYTNNQNHRSTQPDPAFGPPPRLRTLCRRRARPELFSTARAWLQGAFELGL
jgi:hypothetical protein